MTTVQKITGAVVAVVLLVLLLTVVSLALPQPQSSSEVTFSCAGVSTSSNKSSASIVIRNPSSSEKMVYVVGDPEFKSSGFWGTYVFPMGVRMQLLDAGKTATNVVTAPAGSGEARVPILWGFPTPIKANRWQQLWDNVNVYARLHNARGRGALYTNFVTGIKM